jgi:hypothetical protein
VWTYVYVPIILACVQLMGKCIPEWRTHLQVSAPIGSLLDVVLVLPSIYISLFFLFSRGLLFYLEMETKGSYETLVPTYQTTRRHIPENCNLNIHGHENTKSHIATETKQPSIHLMWNSERIKMPRLSEEKAENRDEWELGARIP